MHCLHIHAESKRQIIVSIPPPLWPHSVLCQSVVNVWAKQFPLSCFLIYFAVKSLVAVCMKKTLPCFLHDIHSHRVVFWKHKPLSAHSHFVLVPCFIELYVSFLALESPFYHITFIFSKHNKQDLQLFTSTLQFQVLGVVLQWRLYFVPHGGTGKTIFFPSSVSVTSDYATCPTENVKSYAVTSFDSMKMMVRNLIYRDF